MIIEKSSALLLAGAILASITSKHITQSFPSIILNQCERPLVIGENIMGSNVLSVDSAPSNQNHGFTLADVDGNEIACGSSIVQGSTFVINVEPELISLVTASGWTAAVGPSYIVEAVGAILSLNEGESNERRGCGNSRMENPTGNIEVTTTEVGDVTVRLLSAPTYGQVYAANECVVTVEASQMELVTQTGFLVDNVSWELADSTLATTPFLHTVETLLANNSSGYGILEQVGDTDSFALKYTLDDAGNKLALDLLQNIEDPQQDDIQVTAIGFQSEDGTSLNVVTINRCLDSTSCEGYYSTQVCLSAGLCIPSSVVNADEGTLTTTVTSDDGAWFGIGFSTPGGGMTAGGQGADIFVCSQEGLRRFFVTGKSNPTNFPTVNIQQDNPSDAEIQNICTIQDGQGTMTFTRTLEAQTGAQRTVTPGEPQTIIWARGPNNEAALSSRHDRRDSITLDLTNLAGGVSAAPKQTAPWILWLHIIFMALAWGLMLPLGVAIANRTRNVEGAVPGAWFKLHKGLQRLGWTLQLLGVIMGAYYCEVYSSHLQWDHTKIGVAVVVVGTLQPFNALLRQHPPKGGWPDGNKPIGRVMFEVVHKGLGWGAIILGMFNVFWGAKLVQDDIEFESKVRNVPLSIGSIGTALFVFYMVLGFISPNNAFFRLITGAK